MTVPGASADDPETGSGSLVAPHQSAYGLTGAALPEWAPEGGALAKTLRTAAHRALIAILVASRREAGLTQRQLAERLKRPQSYVAKIEAGERRVDLVELVAIAKALKLDPRQLLERFLTW